MPVTALFESGEGQMASEIIPWQKHQTTYLTVRCTCKWNDPLNGRMYVYRLNYRNYFKLESGLYNMFCNHKITCEHIRTLNACYNRTTLIKKNSCRIAKTFHFNKKEFVSNSKNVSLTWTLCQILANKADLLWSTELCYWSFEW